MSVIKKQKNVHCRSIHEFLNTNDEQLNKKRLDIYLSLQPKENLIYRVDIEKAETKMGQEIKKWGTWIVELTPPEGSEGPPVYGFCLYPFLPRPSRGEAATVEYIIAACELNLAGRIDYPRRRYSPKASSRNPGRLD